MLHRVRPVVVGIAALAAAFLSLPTGAVPDWAVRPGTIWHALSQPNGARVYLDAVVVGKIEARQNPPYFVIREFFDKNARIIVYAPPPRELRLGQTVDVEGTLATLPAGDRALVSVVVLAYLDAQGNLLYHGPLLKGPFKPTPWRWKRPLTVGATTSAVGPLSASSPRGPNALLEGGPIYCPTIADAKAQPDDTVVELQCKPVASVGSGSFVMGEDPPSSDTLTTYYTGAVNSTDRINRVTGTMETDGEEERVLDVDSGPSFNEQGYMGRAQPVASGTVGWAKTFPDGTTLPAALEDKLVSRAFPARGRYYIQEPNSAAGIAVEDVDMSLTLTPQAVVSIPAQTAQITTVDGERAITPSETILGSPANPPKPLGVNNRDLGGGAFNVYTPGPTGAFGLSNVGLLVRTWGGVTSVGDGFFYLDDGSALDDGTGPTGVRVTEVYGYMPDVGDCVAVTGVAGIEILAGNPARVVRMGTDSDLTSLSVTPYPINVLAITTGSGKISIYWDGVAGATGYYVYRGLASGEEDYDNPVNQAPVTQPTYAGGNRYVCTDSGLDNGTTYYYTVEGTSVLGLGRPSGEDSEVPADGAIPWDTPDPALILGAIQTALGQQLDYIRACGPDGRIYQSGSLTPLPPDGTFARGLGVIVLNTGEIVPCTHPYGPFGTKPPPSKLANGGPYHRVMTREPFRGGAGSFYLAPYTIKNMFLANEVDRPHAFLGCHVEDDQHKTVVEVDAGCRFMRPAGAIPACWEPFQATYLKGSGRGYDQTHLFNFPPLPWGALQAASWANLTFRIWPGMTTLLATGTNVYGLPVAVVIANPYAEPEMNPPLGGKAQIKCVHAIAQKGPENAGYYWNTGSRFQLSEVDGMSLLSGWLQWALWTADSTDRTNPPRNPLPPRGWPPVVDCEPEHHDWIHYHVDIWLEGPP